MSEKYIIMFYEALAFVGIGVFVWKKCWKPSIVLGPNRWEENENPALLLILSGAGFLAWMFASQVLMARPEGATSQPTTRPLDLRGVAAATAGQLIGLATLVLGNLAARRNGLQTMGFGKPHRGVLPGLGAAAVALPLVFATSLATMLLWKWIHYQHPEKHDVLQVLVDARGLEKWIPIVSAVVVAPLFEETLFRGHLQTFFKRTFHAPRNETLGAWMSILIASGMFMVVHPAWTYPPIFVLAVCMGYVYERTGNLWSTILLHMIFNGVQVSFSMMV